MAAYTASWTMSDYRLGYPRANSSTTTGCQLITTTSATQQHPLGARIRASDPVFGECEFVYAVGVASTAAGDACTIAGDYTTARAVGGTTKGLIGIAMSANVASQYGWYLIAGRGYVNIAGDVAAAPAYATATAGSVDDAVVAGSQIVGMNLALGLAAGGSAIVGHATLLTPANKTVAVLYYPSQVAAV